MRVAEVARQHDLTRQHIYHWRRELRHIGLIQVGQAILVPVEVGAGTLPPVLAGIDHGHDARVDVILGKGRIVRSFAFAAMSPR
jgi:transposase